jgi:hypothetical protein
METGFRDKIGNRKKKLGESRKSTSDNSYITHFFQLFIHIYKFLHEKFLYVALTIKNCMVYRNNNLYNSNINYISA